MSKLKDRVSRSAYQNLTYNLRYRWKEELAPYDDCTLYFLYNDFALSEDFGNNDEKFPNWFDLLPAYAETDKELRVVD